jgi:protein TonB
MRLAVAPALLGSWPQPFERLDPDSRALAIALSISIVIHAIVLSIHFKLPEALRGITPSQLDVVLVNSKTRSRPNQPDVLAQANLDGGGDTDLERRMKSPLPVLQPPERGADLKQASRRVEDLEARQRQLLSQRDSSTQIAEPESRADASSQVSGSDLVESALIIARMEAQIARQVDEYNKRPRKTFVGARAAEVRYAIYVEDWRQKVERIGNLNYPEGARGKIYGTLRLTVSINSDGTLAAMDLERSSGYKILDAAAEQIVRLAAPYAKFPPDIRKETDILVITRTWRFARGDRVFSD